MLETIYRDYHAAGQEEGLISLSKQNATPEDLAGHLALILEDAGIAPKAVAELPHKLAAFAHGYLEATRRETGARAA